jgi:hypothetical protein
VLFSAISAALCGSLRLRALLTQRTQRAAEGRRELDVRHRLMECSGAERVMMGSRMFLQI